MPVVFLIFSVICGAMIGLSFTRWRGLKPTRLTIGTAIFGILVVPSEGGRKDVLAGEPKARYRATGICFAALWLAMFLLTQLR